MTLPLHIIAIIHAAFDETEIEWDLGHRVGILELDRKISN